MHTYEQKAIAPVFAFLSETGKKPQETDGKHVTKLCNKVGWQTLYGCQCYDIVKLLSYVTKLDDKHYMAVSVMI